MSTLKLMQAAPVVPLHPEGFTEAERGDVEALGQLLARAIDRNGYKYREALQSVITTGADEASSLPAESLEWRHIACVELEQGEGAALSAWEDVKQAAREELVSGHRAAMVMEGSGATPMDRARFLVLRESFATEWKPVNGIEWQLIDQMTQAATAQSYWTEKLTMRTMQEAAEDLRDRQELSKNEQMYRWGEWLPERVTTAEAIASCMGMVDRWNRVFLRCLRQLRDLRRFNVIINSPGQVNIADRQINMRPEAGSQKSAKKRRR